MAIKNKTELVSAIVTSTQHFGDNNSMRVKVYAGDTLAARTAAISKARREGVLKNGIVNPNKWQEFDVKWV